MDTIGKQLLSSSNEIMRLNARVNELENKLIRELANNFQYEAEKGTPGYLLERARKAEARVKELEDAIRKHKGNNPSIDHGIYWWRRDTELYAVLEKV
jgi:vacuolar-type H+-ATPase subunit D/Vma8